MSYLKTNLRLTANELGPTVLGGGLNNFLDGGSTGGPQGVAEGRAGKFYGGVVMWSMSTAQSGVISIATDSVLALAYGVTMVSNLLNGASGYKVVPITIQHGSVMSHVTEYEPNFSYDGTSIIYITPKAVWASDVAGYLYTALPASNTHKLVITGLIASAPYGPWA